MNKVLSIVTMLLLMALSVGAQVDNYSPIYMNIDQNNIVTDKVNFVNSGNYYAGLEQTNVQWSAGANTANWAKIAATASNTPYASVAALATNSEFANTATVALATESANTAELANRALWAQVAATASNLVGGIPSSVTSIYTRALIDDSDLITISNRVIYNAAGNKIADLNAFIIYSNGVISADFDKRLFYNFSGNKVFDYNLGKLYNAAGTVTIIDILEGMIRTPAGGQSVDYKNRLLYSSSGDASINYNTLKLLGPWSVDTTADEDGEIVDYTLLTNVYYTITDEYTNAIDLAIQAYSNYMNTVTNDFQDQILNQSNRINGVSNYVVNITNEYVRTNHTLTINGTVGNFDSNLVYTITSGGATESTTNYIDAGNLANSNHTIGVSNFVDNTALNWTNNTYINLSSRWLMSGGQAVLRWGSSTLYDVGNHLTLNWNERTLVGDDILGDDPWEIDIRPMDDYDIADIYTVTTSVHSLSNSLILALNSSTNALRNELTNSLTTVTLNTTNLFVNGNTLITNGSLRVYSSAGSGVPDLQIGRYNNTLGFGFNAKNEANQPIPNNPWFRIAGGANDGLVLNPGNHDAFLIFGNDKRATIALGSGASKVGVNTLSPVSGFAFDVAGSANIRTNLYVTNSIVLANNGALRIKEAGTGNELVTLQKASDNVVRTYTTVRYDVINAGTPSKTNASFDIANERTTLLGPLRIGGAHIGTISETSELQIMGVAHPTIVMGVNGADKGTNGIVFSHNGGVGSYYSRKKNGIFSRYNGTGWSRGDLHFVLNNEGNANGYDFFPDTRMIIRSSGETCIGNTNTVSGSKLTVSGNTTINGNLTVTNMIYGDRTLLTFGKTSGGTTNFYGGYAALTGSTNASIIAIRDGSVIGMSSRFNVTAQTTAGDLWCEVWIEDTVALSNKVAISGTGWYNCIATTNRGVYPFTAGKPLIIYHRFVGFAGSIGGVYDSIEIVNDN